MVSWFLAKVPKYFSEERIVISASSSRKLDIHIGKWASTHYTPQIKMNLKLITDLTVTDETIKFKEESREELHNLLLHKELLDRTQKGKKWQIIFLQL